MTKCTQQCFCVMTTSLCSSGCGTADGWYTAGAACKQDRDVRKYKWQIS